MCLPQHAHAQPHLHQQLFVPAWLNCTTSPVLGPCAYLSMHMHSIKTSCVSFQGPHAQTHPHVQLVRAGLVSLRNLARAWTLCLSERAHARGGGIGYGDSSWPALPLPQTSSKENAGA